MTHEFDKSKYKDVTDVARELAEISLRIQDRDDKIFGLICENDIDTHRVSQLDRWMLSIFEANPDIQAVKTSANFREVTIIPDGDMCLVVEACYPNNLMMTPYPIEPDADDDIEYDDDFVPPPSIHHITADLLGRNGNRIN